MALSLNAKGLAMDDLEDELCRWMLLTKGRTVNPPGNEEEGVSLRLWWPNPKSSSKKLRPTVVLTAFWRELHRFGQRCQGRASGGGSRGQAGSPAAWQPVDPVVAQRRAGGTCSTHRHTHTASKPNTLARRRSGRSLTSDRAVCGPGGNSRPPLVEQDVGRLLTHILIGYWRYLAVVKAVPLAVNGVLAVGCRRQRPRGVNMAQCCAPVAWHCWYLYSGRHACFHGGCIRRTGRKGSRLDFFLVRTAVSTATSVRVNSSCSDSSSPHGAPCPCPSTGTSPCSASSPCGRPPATGARVKQTGRWEHACMLQEPGSPV